MIVARMKWNIFCVFSLRLQLSALIPLQSRSNSATHSSRNWSVSIHCIYCAAFRQFDCHRSICLHLELRSQNLGMRLYFGQMDLKLILISWFAEVVDIIHSINLKVVQQRVSKSEQRWAEVRYTTSVCLYFIIYFLDNGKSDCSLMISNNKIDTQ